MKEAARSAPAEKIFEVADLDHLRFYGQHDQNLTALETLLPVVIRVEGERLHVSGDGEAVARAGRVIDHMLAAVRRGTQVTPDDVALATKSTPNGEAAIPSTLFTTPRGKEIRPRTQGQRAFVESIESRELTIGAGPAGTGKTFLAVVMAVRALRRREVARVILTRPAVEAGEKLGFLPGDVKEKVDPYLRPLYDALGEMLDDQVVGRYLERGIIEVAPLAYMRGRTLADAFIILDEAQNATREQLKMFLTRLGSGSKMVVTGDPTQIDLPPGARSGLLDAHRLFDGVAEIGIVELGTADVVRPALVGKIIQAYDRLSQKRDA
ncbi:MAG TPA: PhoH family protein [Candidatus Acidoferrales bacterium]|nr:PhoH family protein [Candidatus Acidoferrales bacterium]